MLLTVTPTVPGACAGVFAVMVVALTTITFVAAAPPNVTFAPFWKPLPPMVTFLPPDDLPAPGVTEVTVTMVASGVTFAFPDSVSAQPAALVTVTCGARGPPGVTVGLAGIGLTVTVVAAEAALLHPFAVTITV